MTSLTFPPPLPPLHSNSLSLSAVAIAGIALALVWYLSRYAGRMRHSVTSSSTVHPSTRLLPFRGNGRAGWTPAGGTGTQGGPGEDTVLSVAPSRIWWLPFHRARPRPLRWVVEGLVPWGEEPPWWHWGSRQRAYVSAILGTGGVGKSSILIDLAVALLVGQDWLGSPVRKVRRVLYVDTELTVDMARRRATPIARGRGVPEPKGLKYLHPSGSLAARYTKTEDGEEGYMSDGMAAIGDAVRKTKAEVLLVDSLTIGSPGASLSDQNAWNRIINGLESLGIPVILIDHMGKSGTGGAVGSFIKQAKTRSVLELSPGSGGRIKVEHTKSNFGPLLPPMTVECQRLGPDPLDPTCVYYATKEAPAMATLYPFGSPEGMEDDRPAPIPLRALPAPQTGPDAATRAILAYCQAHAGDAPWVQGKLTEALEGARVGLGRSAIQGRLKAMVEEGLLVRDDRRRLSLPTPGAEEEVTSA